MANEVQLMKTSINTGVLSPKFVTLRESIPMLKEAGFDCFDISLYEEKGFESFFNKPNYMTEAKELRKIADACGITCNQSHSVYPTSYPDDTDEHITANKELPEKIRRTIEIASVLGAKSIVVHPRQHLHWCDHANELLEENISFYESLEGYCRQYGIKVALENMWQRNRYGNAIVDSTCSTPSEFVAYMDRLNPDYFIACLDIGHCTLTDHDPADMIRALGHSRLHALHVHDNDGVGDLHTVPFQPNHAKVNWNSVIDALVEIDYDGDITLETDYFMRNIPLELVPASLKYASATARYLGDAIERKRQ